jgi:hypothetical protein
MVRNNNHLLRKTRCLQMLAKTNISKHQQTSFSAFACRLFWAGFVRDFLVGIFPVFLRDATGSDSDSDSDFARTAASYSATYSLRINPLFCHRPHTSW